jgi:hypothetical protein
VRRDDECTSRGRKDVRGVEEGGVTLRGGGWRTFCLRRCISRLTCAQWLDVRGESEWQSGVRGGRTEQFE